MRVAVISQIRPGCPRAHAINVIKTAGGFERLGHEVTVYCLEPEPGHEPEPGAWYGEDRLRWCFAPNNCSDDAPGFGRWAAAASTDAGFVYGRNFWGPLLTAEAGIPTVMESHAHPGTKNEALERCMRATRRTGLSVVTIGDVLRQDFISRGADASRVAVVPDGVDFELFDRASPRDYTADGHAGPHVVYAGHLYDYKGIPTVLEAAQCLPSHHFHLLGGLEPDIERVRGRIEAMGLHNVSLHGRVAHAAVPAWTRGADVLLLPPSGGEASRDWTSPVKLGEYLASGPPVVASRIPALVEALDGEPVEWFEPDDASDLASAIRRAVETGASTAARTRRRALARTLGYEARARRIMRTAGLPEDKIQPKAAA